MSLQSSFNGAYFKDPRILTPMTVTNLSNYDTGNTSRASTAVAFFTGVASYGVIDSTNWAANTYKTIYSHTGMGLVGHMIACTAGGAETTTFEITIDGVKSEITVTNANGERAMLHVGIMGSTEADFTTAGNITKNADGGLDAGTGTTYQTANVSLIPMEKLKYLGCGMLRYDISCLIRMKHSAIITNSTATAYSGVYVRKGIAA